MAPIVAEVYGPRYADQRRPGAEIRRIFERTADIVDVDDSMEEPAPRFIIEVDRQQAALLGVSQEQLVQTLPIGLEGADVTYVHMDRERHPIPVRVELPVADQADVRHLLELEVRAASGARVPLSELVEVRESLWDGAIYHKDLLPVVYVTGDMAGRLDSP